MAQLSDKLNAALSDQIQQEIGSAYFYLALSSRCETLNFKGAASWLKFQWEEELVHALKIVDFVNDRGNAVDFKEIGAPTGDFKSLLEIFQNVLEHERTVSASINKLYGLAISEQDFAAQAFLQWFVTEQVEEESTASDIVENLRLAGSEGSMLLMIDQQLSSRILTGEGTA
jgi:ferritin